MRNFYLELQTLPIISFAHVYSTDHYDTYFEVQENFVEITYILEGNITLFHDGIEEIIPENAILVSVRTKKERAYSKCTQKHVTFGFHSQLIANENEKAIENLISAEHNTTREQNEASVCRVFLQNYAIYTEGKKYREQLFRLVEEYYLQQKTTVKIQSMIFSILSELDSEARKAYFVHSDNYADLRYTERAKRYIINHLSEKIYVENIAASVELSVGYLSNIFRRYTGETLIEYVHKTKLRKVSELVRGRGLSIREASAAMGYEDGNYVSRIYKKYFGENLKRERLQVKTEDILPFYSNNLK